MNPEMILTFVILGITIVVFITDKLRVDVVAMLALLALTLTGIISSGEALAGFSNSTVVMIAALFVVGGGLFRTGVADWLGNKMLALAGNSDVRLIGMLMVGTGLLSGFLSNTGTVAVLIPAVVAAAWRIKTVPSKLLLPLAFAASIGGMMTLIGTPPNIVIANALRDAGQETFGFFEFALIGLPLLIVGTLYILFMGRQWLPEREPGERRSEVTSSVDELVDTYRIGDQLYRLRVRRGSKLAGKTLGEADLHNKYDVTVLRVDREIRANGEGGLRRREAVPQKALESIAGRLGVEYDPDPEMQSPNAETRIEQDDVLLVEATSKALNRMAVDLNVALQPPQSEEDSVEEGLLSHEAGLAEILITPRSALIGKTLVQSNFARKYQVRVLGIWRQGKAIDSEKLLSTQIAFGDALLVHGSWRNIEVMQSEVRNFVIVGQPAEMASAKGLTLKSVLALGTMLGMLVLLLTGVVPTVIAVVIAAMVMVLTGCLSMEQAYRSVSWESVILIAAMLPMSTALENTGGALFIADALVNTLGAYHPLLLLAGIFILTATFTQVISNTATTVLLAPIVLAAASELGVSAKPIMMMVAVGASAAFLTPIASPVNTLVLSPGGYRFGDFMKIGMPLLILFLIISLILVPLIWPL